jgi:hypothetical protein
MWKAAFGLNQLILAPNYPEGSIEDSLKVTSQPPGYGSFMLLHMILLLTP